MKKVYTANQVSEDAFKIHGIINQHVPRNENGYVKLVMNVKVDDQGEKVVAGMRLQLAGSYTERKSFVKLMMGLIGEKKVPLDMMVLKEVSKDGKWTNFTIQSIERKAKESYTDIIHIGEDNLL